MCSCSVMSCRGCAAVLADDCANDMQSLSAVDPHFLAIAGPPSEGGGIWGCRRPHYLLQVVPVKCGHMPTSQATSQVHACTTAVLVGVRHLIWGLTLQWGQAFAFKFCLICKWCRLNGRNKKSGHHAKPKRPSATAAVSLVVVILVFLCFYLAWRYQASVGFTVEHMQCLQH